MAGSYAHCKANEGEFRFELIENMGDAHEACHMMFWMIDFLSGGDDRKVKRAEDAYYRQCRSNYGDREP